MKKNWDSIKKSIPSVLSHVSEEVAVSARGSWITTASGRRLLDFASGIGMLSTGHCHPRVVSAVQAQAGALLHAQINCIYYDRYLEVSDRLLREAVPLDSGLDRLVLNTTGAEAVEGAVKLARHATGRPNVVAFQGGFHGRSALAVALTSSKTVYRAGYQPLPSGCFISSFPYCHRCPTPPGGGGCCLRALDDLRLLLKTQSAPSETAAIIVEPVLGEGGYVPASSAFLRGLRELCDEHGMLLIYDEVQSGFGRTGHMFAYETLGAPAPDVLVMAKGIASGLPLSAIAMRAEHAERWGPPGAHGGTYIGSPIACAAAAATLDVFQEEKVLENVKRRSKEVFERLRPGGAIADVRGLGLMVGVEFDDGKVAAGFAGRVVRRAEERGLLVLACGAHETVRLIPPLVATKEDIATGMDILEESIQDVLKSE